MFLNLNGPWGVEIHNKLRVLLQKAGSCLTNLLFVSVEERFQKSLYLYGMSLNHNSLELFY